MKILSKADLMNLYKPQTKEVVLRNDVGLLIKKLNANDVLELQSTIKDGKPSKDYFLELISISLVDENNKNYLSKSECGNLDPETMNKILSAISEFNNFKIDDVRSELKENPLG